MQDKAPRNGCCFVPMCTSGYRSNPERVSLFSVPKEKNRRTLWTEAIARSDRVLSERDVICEKHFTSDDVVREWKCGPVTVPYSRPKLKEHAVPSVFPCYPKYLRKKRPRETEPTVVVTDDDVIVDTQSSQQDFFFQLYDKTVSVSLPSLAWSVLPLRENGRHYVLISEMSLRYARPFMEKQVVISQELRVSLYAGSKLIVNEHIGHLTKEAVRCTDEIEDILYKFSLLNLCYGGPRLDESDSTVVPECAVVDSAFDCLRHRKCTLVLAHSERCKFCVMVTKMFKNDNKR